MKGRNWLCESQRHERLDAAATVPHRILPSNTFKHPERVIQEDLHYDPGQAAIIKVQSKADDASKSQQHNPTKATDERGKIREDI